MSTAASFFALPERLRAKRAHDLIAADEHHFARVIAALERTVSSLQERMDALLAAPGGWGQRALERDLEVHRLGARLRRLRRFGLDLCLGRLVGADGDVVYIGRLGLVDDDGERLLVDWRSPAAEPFFAATHADPRGLTSRRRYRWTAGRVTDYWDEAFTEEGLAAPVALDDHSAFIASLGSSRTARMRDVLGTLQADQDAIIRSGSHGPLVVDGGPGTGKTVVALHRAAYLLYADERVARGGVLFVGPNPGYLAYVADVLPNLGEDEVRIATLRDLVPEGAEAGEEGDARAAAVAASGALVEAIEAVVADRERPPTRELTIETDWGEVVVGPDDWADAFDAADPGAPHNEARDQVRRELLELLAAGSDVPLDAIDEDDDLRRALDRAWPLLDPVALVGALRSDPALLRRSAPGLTDAEIAAVQRSDPRAWTAADLPLLDAARHRIGDPDAARARARREAAADDQREGYQQVIDTLLAAADDGEDLISMFRPGDLREVLVDEAALPARDPDALAGPFAHIVVDEAQELTDAEWGMLVRRCPSRSFTIVGDRAQSRRLFAESWEERLARVGLTGAITRGLSINYRTPVEVMAVAEPVIRAAIPDANVPESVRSTGRPVVNGSVEELDGIVQAWLAAHEVGLVCVIGEPAHPSSERVRSLGPELAKGLEFDLVVLVDPERWSAVDRYVAMTRATQDLVILTSAPVAVS